MSGEREFVDCLLRNGHTVTVDVTTALAGGYIDGDEDMNTWDVLQLVRDTVNGDNSGLLIDETGCPLKITGPVDAYRYRTPNP